jgi:uncharacterized protein
MLNDKVVVITGASSGIGAELALLLAKEGATMVLAARRQHKLDAVARQVRHMGRPCIAIRCDVSKRIDAERLVRRTIREFGKIDILVNNAGSGHLASIEDTTDRMIRNLFGVNVFALWHTTRPALAYMKARASGHIINIASMAGKLGYPYNSAYVAAKHACVGFTAALRLELAETGVHATIVCPAGVSTDWANRTEGGSMLPLFSQSGPLIKKIAEERSVQLPQIEGVVPANAVAEKILACIYDPVAEVYTHEGSKEFVLLATADRERAERQQIPIVLGERVIYEKMKKKKH